MNPIYVAIQNVPSKVAEITIIVTADWTTKHQFWFWNPVPDTGQPIVIEKTKVFWIDSDGTSDISSWLRSYQGQVGVKVNFGASEGLKKGDTFTIRFVNIVGNLNIWLQANSGELLDSEIIKCKRITVFS